MGPIDSLFSPSKYETWTDVVSMSGQRRRRWINIQTTSGRRSVLARNVEMADIKDGGFLLKLT